MTQWLMLMQHYGLPTRLLDWSEGILVALFFAVENRELDSRDGALWGLDAGRLNEFQTNPPGTGRPIFFSGSPAVIDIAAGSFHTPPRTAAVQVAAFLPEHTDLRMMIQHGRCTIHASGAPLDDQPHASDFLLKAIVPAAKKAFWRKKLRQLGVERSLLFPDMGSLAQSLRELQF